VSGSLKAGPRNRCAHDLAAHRLRALKGADFVLMTADIFMPRARLRIDQDIHERATGSADCHVRLRLRQPRLPAPDFLRAALELGAARCPRKPFTSMAGYQRMSRRSHFQLRGRCRVAPGFRRTEFIRGRVARAPHVSLRICLP
jgi:hypothetical protein